MALINCPECAKEISDKASACPHCGYPIAEYIEEQKYTAEVQRLLDKIIEVEYKYPSPRQTVCIKCGAPHMIYSRAPQGIPMCKCNFNGRPYPAYEVDFSNGGRLLSLGNELYIRNKCTIPMNIGDQDSPEYSSYVEKLEDNIRRSNQANQAEGLVIKETPPDPRDYMHPNIGEAIPPQPASEPSQENIPHCPICNSTKLKKISTVRKASKVSLFGIYGAGDLGKTWQCENCGSKF